MTKSNNWQILQPIMKTAAARSSNGQQLQIATEEDNNDAQIAHKITTSRYWTLYNYAAPLNYSFAEQF